MDSADTGSSLPDFQWYAVVSASQDLEQGDIFFDFPVAEPPAGFPSISRSVTEGESIEEEALVSFYNLILMTQSCDLPKLVSDNYVILCPFYDIKAAKLPDGKSLANREGWSNLRRGRLVSAHLLNRCNIPNVSLAQPEA